MPLNDITTDHGSVAGTQLPGHAQPFADHIVAGLVDLHFEARLLQMSDPVFTAPTVRVFPDLDGCAVAGCMCAWQSQYQDGCEQHSALQLGLKLSAHGFLLCSLTTKHQSRFDK